jgi:hypothetical protein
MKEQLCCSVSEVVSINNGNVNMQILVMKLWGRMAYHIEPEVGHLKKKYMPRLWITELIQIFSWCKIPVSKICQHTWRRKSIWCKSVFSFTTWKTVWLPIIAKKENSTFWKQFMASLSNLVEEKIPWLSDNCSTGQEISSLLLVLLVVSATGLILKPAESTVLPWRYSHLRLNLATSIHR